MTTSSTSTFELTRDQLFRRAYQFAGLLEASQNPSADDLSMAADFLGMELQALQVNGIVVTHVERTTLALVIGTQEYSLPSDTLDVAVGPDNVCGTIVPASGVETPVKAISRAEFIATPNKTAQSTPTQVYIERAATVKAVFWMIPSATCSFRYGKIRLPRDMDIGTRTLDLARRWQKAICFSMAYQIGLAKSIPMNRVKFLLDEAERHKSMALASDGEKAHAQFTIAGRSM